MRSASINRGVFSGLVVLIAFVSVIFFPWPLTALIALAASLILPLLPLSAGLFADALYFVPHAGAWPLFSIFGALATLAAFFVRSRLAAGIIGE